LHNVDAGVTQWIARADLVDFDGNARPIRLTWVQVSIFRRSLPLSTFLTWRLTILLERGTPTPASIRRSIRTQRIRSRLCGTWKPRQSGRVPGADPWAVATCTSPPTPAAVLLDPCPRIGCALASHTARAPSLSCSSLRRQSSAIRTGCANERPSGSVRGATSNGCPYRDPTTLATSLPGSQLALSPDFGTHPWNLAKIWRKVQHGLMTDQSSYRSGVCGHCALGRHKECSPSFPRPARVAVCSWFFRRTN
jgi:hypothetical protein